MLLIGVDPGLSGAMALIDTRREVLDVQDIPTCSNGTASGSMRRWVDQDALDALLARWSTTFGFAGEDVHAAIERPIPMPSLPAQTIAAQFDTFGVLRAALGRRGAVQYLNPKEWKRLYGLTNDKDAARACALRLYPTAPVQRVKDHNRAESVLIAHWLRKELA